jgi:hypothetical protein
MHTQFRARGAFPRIIVNGIHSRHNRTCLPASFCSVECACKASFGRLKVMAEHKPIRLILLLTLTLGLNACSVFGAASPTPFTFPTPNLTHTAIFASTPSETPLVPTVPPIQASATPVVALATSTVLSGAPTSTQVAVSPTPTASLPPGTTDTRPNGVPVTAVFLTSPVSIDGDLNGLPHRTSPTRRSPMPMPAGLVHLTFQPPTISPGTRISSTSVFSA